MCNIVYNDTHYLKPWEILTFLRLIYTVYTCSTSCPAVHHRPLLLHDPGKRFARNGAMTETNGTTEAVAPGAMEVIWRFPWPWKYPKMDGLWGKIPSRNGWWLGVLLIFNENSDCDQWRYAQYNMASGLAWLDKTKKPGPCAVLAPSIPGQHRVSF